MKLLINSSFEYEECIFLDIPSLFLCTIKSLAYLEFERGRSVQEIYVKGLFHDYRMSH